MSAIQRASFERTRRIQRREDLDAPFIISEAEAEMIAKSWANMQYPNDKSAWKTLYDQIVDGQFSLYALRVVVRGHGL